MSQLSTCCMEEMSYVFICVCFLNTMLQHCYVPDRFGYGLIVPLLKDKHGDQSRSDRGRKRK